MQPYAHVTKFYKLHSSDFCYEKIHSMAPFFNKCHLLYAVITSLLKHKNFPVYAKPVRAWSVKNRSPPTERHRATSLSTFLVYIPCYFLSHSQACAYQRPAEADMGMTWEVVASLWLSSCRRLTLQIRDLFKSLIPATDYKPHCIFRFGNLGFYSR